MFEGFADWLFIFLLAALVFISIGHLIQGGRAAKRMEQNLELLREWLDHLEDQDS